MFTIQNSLCRRLIVSFVTVFVFGLMSDICHFSGNGRTFSAATPDQPILKESQGDARSRRADDSNEPDPNVALEGQCIVVCDANVVGLKPDTRYRDAGDGRETNREQTGSNTQGRNPQASTRSTKLWDNLPFAAPNLCGGFAGGKRPRRVAFSVTRNTMMGMPEGMDNGKPTITFDNIVVNVGNGFNGQSSTFVAPVSGVYSLNFQVFRLYNRNPLTVTLTVNENAFFEGFANGDAGNYEPAQNGGLIHLRERDSVKLIVSNGNLDSGWKFSTFSGHLIFENEDY